MEPCSQKGPVFPFNALVLSKLTAYLPRPLVVEKTSKFLCSLNLADTEPEHNKRIELIIGADVYGAVLRDGIIRGPSGSPMAQFTIFGWVISGPVCTVPQNLSQSFITVNHTVANDFLNEYLRKFWELEEVP